ncbi:hypothetical protein [Psychroflexus sp. ALD_RP9]|uniref:hypothetical protein n=1 Tax=Psychroflexus sp. ALD_RP9 TaxID=2777186 RepID=UPI001A9079CA|nr:hypothetical protein [Psychroflexus sp. ALD_RP9]QSS96347.1 hypothetical protein IMZ30_07715 [Psychroflexus sp. ALD_RP9]
MTIKERYQSKTPRFFKKLRNIGLGITAVAGALLTAPVALPALVVSVAGYGLAVGTAVSAVSQVVTKADDQAAEVLDDPKGKSTQK